MTAHPPPPPVLRGRQAVPTAWSTVRTLAGVTLRRIARGKALWIGAAIAALPIAYAVVARGGRTALDADDMLLRVLPVLALLPAMFVAASIGEELEQRTSTYLWSRPIARWAVLAGKLCALAPIVTALTVASWFVAAWIGSGAAPPVPSSIALAVGSIAVCLVAAGIAVVVPRYGMALTIGYALVDIVIGVLPFSLSELSITHQVRALAHLTAGPSPIAAPVIAMAVVSGVWSVIGFVRITRLET